MNGLNQRQIKNRRSEAVRERDPDGKAQAMLRGEKGVRSGLMMAAHMGHKLKRRRTRGTDVVGSTRYFRKVQILLQKSF
jgi:hypothetical protein